MIAVLPFEHLGGDPEREYLTDGLAEELSASLGQIDPEHLSVKGRTSTRMYKRTGKSPADIGRELRVEYVVEGSVRVESGRLRVTSKLIRVRDQVQIWAESFDSESGNMLELQRELSAGIAKQVRLRLSPDRLTALAPRHARQCRGLRPLPSRPALVEPVDDGDESTSRRILPAGDATRSKVCARVGWPGGHLLSKPDQQRCGSVGGNAASERRNRARGRLGP